MIYCTGVRIELIGSTTDLVFAVDKVNSVTSIITTKMPDDFVFEKGLNINPVNIFLKVVNLAF